MPACKCSEFHRSSGLAAWRPPVFARRTATPAAGAPGVPRALARRATSAWACRHAVCADLGYHPAMSSERYPGPLPLPDPRLRRRAFLGSVAAGGAFAAGATLIGGDALAQAKAPAKPSLVAVPPAGFVPLDLPGRIVKVTRGNTMQPNGLWPTEEAAQIMLERAMTELTGKNDIGQAFAQLRAQGRQGGHQAQRHRRPEGRHHGRQQGAGAGGGARASSPPACRPTNISVFEQYPSFMAGTRVADRAGVIDTDFPPGIRAFIHKNEDATMPSIDRGRHPDQVRAPVHRGHRGDQRRPHQGPLNLRLHRVHEEHHPRRADQPARVPRAQRQPADRRTSTRRTW